jgi:hypothetical protein
MSGARHQNLLSQARHSFLQAVESLPIYRDYPVELACYEERGLANLRSAEKWRQLPKPVYVAAARLMGADCIISGIRPQIAQTMVHLQIDLSAVTTKATMAEALRFALKRSGRATRGCLVD